MYRFLDGYRIYERIAGILVLLTVGLYMLSCLAVSDLATLGQFGDYVYGLVAYLFK